MILALFSEETSSGASVEGEVERRPLGHIVSPPAISVFKPYLCSSYLAYFQETSNRDKGSGRRVVEYKCLLLDR